ncbi:hypothetical protein CNR22_13635 [Sphingobacteriaceae bacterium]|nr:hypothetical protein CNR22_13635 [Sphingobacteriaceae bacterium]
MKKSILITAGLMISLAACAQKVKESEVPAVVKDAFKKSYKDAKEVKWEKEGANFEAEFEIGETDQSVAFDATGHLVETEVEIKVEELPSGAKDYFAKNYKDTKIKEATKITDAKGTVTYEAEIKGKDLIFDSTGKFIKEEVDTYEDKD